MQLTQIDTIDREALAKAKKGKLKQINAPVFESLADALDAANGEASKNWGDYRSSRKKEKSGDFYATKDWPECKKLIASGWSEGREKVAAQLGEIFASGAAALAAGEAVAHEVGGAYPDVPLYVAGEVCHMVSEGEQLGERPIIKLIVSVSASCSVAANRVMNRGAAITALVDQIESAGNSCEIYATWPTESFNGKAFNAPFVRVKAAGEVVSIDDIAFSLGHASMLRRLFFGLIEIDPATDGWGFQSGYGLPRDIPAAALPTDAIYLRGMNNESDRYKTPEGAMEFVREKYNEQAEANGLETVGGAE